MGYFNYNFRYDRRGHFNDYFFYPTSVDYDTNSASYYDYLATVNKYLHDLDHILLELEEIIQDITQRLVDIEENIKEAVKYAHVPSVLVKADNTHDYITVDNKERLESDGLPKDFIDKYNQKHIMDTSKLDSFIDNQLKYVGIETEIAGGHQPGDDTCTALGNLTKYDEIKVYWSSLTFSIPRTFTIATKEVGGKSSFVFANITDEPERPSIAHSEIGQTLCEIKGTIANAQICYYNSQLLRLENDGGTGANNAWNRMTAEGNTIQPGGRFSVSTSWWENGTNPNYGKGWINILRITGVNYGLQAPERDLQAAVIRANEDNYIGFEDYYRNIRYAIGARLIEEQVALLARLEVYKKELSNIIASGYTEKMYTEYDRLLKYRYELKGRL